MTLLFSSESVYLPFLRKSILTYCRPQIYYVKPNPFTEGNRTTGRRVRTCKIRTSVTSPTYNPVQRRLSSLSPSKFVDIRSIPDLFYFKSENKNRPYPPDPSWKLSPDFSKEVSCSYSSNPYGRFTDGHVVVVIVSSGKRVSYRGEGSESPRMTVTRPPL